MRIIIGFIVMFVLGYLCGVDDKNAIVVMKKRRCKKCRHTSICNRDDEEEL